MHPGIPVDPADLQQVAGLVQKGLEEVFSQFLGGFKEGFHVLLFIGGEPLPVVVHANTPEKINGLGGKAGKHRFTSFQLTVM